MEILLAWLVLAPLLALVVGRLLRGHAGPAGTSTVLDELSARRAAGGGAPSSRSTVAS